MMVNTIRGKPGPLQINVATDKIVLHGDPAESAGKLLQGSVVLDLVEPMKIRSIHLRFSGKMKVSWSEGIGHHQQSHKQERTIISHQWQFFPKDGHSAGKKTSVLPAGNHKWDFELPLPGDLPQTLEAENARVRYRLKAVIERSAFVHNIVRKRPITVMRYLLPSEFALVQNLQIHNTWNDKMMYDIALPSKIYAHGETIPITFGISPIANNLKVRSLSGILKEYCTYSANEHSKTEARTIHHVRQEDPFTASDSLPWNRVIRLSVPSRSPLVFCDTENEMIRIRHKIKFVISLTNADGHVSELRCSVPIIVIDSFAQQDELNDLPSYDEAWRSVPYDQSVWEVLRTRASSISQACRSQLSPFGNQDAREPITLSGRARAISVSSNVSAGTNLSRSLTSKPVMYENEPDMSTPAEAPAPTAQHGASDELGASYEDSPGIWWNGVEISRVPSYATAAQQAAAPFSSSLPPYESLSVSPLWTRHGH